MGDVNNHYEALDRSLKKIGILLVDDSGLLRNGKSVACVDLLRKLLLSTSVPMAKLLLQRGCPSHAPDKKLVAAAFELVRDKIKFLPSLTVDQYFKEGYAAHKLAILVKLATYIADTDKAFSKSQPPKMMYVVPNDTAQGSARANSSRYGELDEEVEYSLSANEESNLDDLDVSESYSDLPPAPPSAHAPPQHSHVHHIEAPQAWPQTDFIKKHILDAKLKNMSNSPARITAAPKNRSTTPTSVRKPKNDSFTSAGGVDIYDIEEKTAALEAIQALRAARNATSNNTSTTYQNNDSNSSHANHTNTNTYQNASPQKNTYHTFSAESSPAYKNNPPSNHNSLSDIAEGRYNPNTAHNGDSEFHNTGMGGLDATAVRSVVCEEVHNKLESDPEVQKLIDRRVEAIVEKRVSAAVQEITTKYDFIINKLVAAVDAEFTLLNNKLAMQQQQHDTQY